METTKKNTTTNKVKTVSTYKVNVLDVNKELKQELPKLSNAIKLLELLTTNEKVLAALKEVEYNKLKKATRKSKAGNYSPFFVLQALYKLGLTKD